MFPLISSVEALDDPNNITLNGLFSFTPYFMYDFCNVLIRWAWFHFPNLANHFLITELRMNFIHLSPVPNPEQLDWWKNKPKYVNVRNE